MTGMGNILATVVLAVPLLSWLRGTLVLGTSQLRLAHVPSVLRGKTHYLGFQFSCYPDSPGATEVRP